MWLYVAERKTEHLYHFLRTKIYVIIDKTEAKQGQIYEYSI